MIKTIAVVASLLALAYAGVCGWMYARQREFTYFPQLTQVDAAATDFVLDRGDGVLRGWVVNPGQSKAVVYFGGNGERIEGNRALFERWLPGHSVYLVAYCGYGASDGSPSQAVLFADALAVFDHVQQRHAGAPAAVVGRSLGSGVASHVASQRRVDALALITPFDSLASVATARYPWLPVRWLLREHYASTHWLAGFRGRVLIVRAGRDEVVPPANTDHLIDALPQPPQVVSMPEAGHNTLDNDVYGGALHAFL